MDESDDEIDMVVVAADIDSDDNVSLASDESEEIVESVTSEEVDDFSSPDLAVICTSKKVKRHLCLSVSELSLTIQESNDEGRTGGND